jgi:hypothetical protein
MPSNTAFFSINRTENPSSPITHEPYTKVERSGESLTLHCIGKLKDFETHFRIKWC